MLVLYWTIPLSWIRCLVAFPLATNGEQSKVEHSVCSVISVLVKKNLSNTLYSPTDISFFSLFSSAFSVKSQPFWFYIQSLITNQMKHFEEMPEELLTYKMLSLSCSVLLSIAHPIPSNPVRLADISQEPHMHISQNYNLPLSSATFPPK